MPRSFLVKKHFNASKKPNYSELDTHTGKRYALQICTRVNLSSFANSEYTPGRFLFNAVLKLSLQFHDYLG